jgi:hypothetical protein
MTSQHPVTLQTFGIRRLLSTQSHEFSGSPALETQQEHEALGAPR